METRLVDLSLQWLKTHHREYYNDNIEPFYFNGTIEFWEYKEVTPDFTLSKWDVEPFYFNGTIEYKEYTSKYITLSKWDNGFNLLLMTKPMVDELISGKNPKKIINQYYKVRSKIYD